MPAGWLAEFGRPGGLVELVWLAARGDELPLLAPSQICPVRSALVGFHKWHLQPAEQPISFSALLSQSLPSQSLASLEFNVLAYFESAGRTYMRIISALATLAMASAVEIPTAVAADFRVQTKVYSGDASQLIGTNSTIFRGGVVYDYMDGSNEVTIFDPAQRRIVLVDVQRGVQAQMSTDEIVQLTSWVKQQASGSNNAFLKFCAQPKFNVSHDAAKQLWKFDSKVLSYQVVTMSPGDAIADQYREFGDWYARFNSIVRPHIQPPFPRLVVNERLARTKSIPKSVRLWISPQPRTGNQEMVIRSVHDVSAEVTPSDLKRVEQTQQQLSSFRRVSIKDFAR